MTHKRILCAVLFVYFSLHAFSSAADARSETVRSSTILSPSPGIWSNYQSVILEVPEDSLAFYSFTGDDPLYSGFAYDGPVLIEKEGTVLLRVVTVAKDNSTAEQSVEYSVTVKSSDEEFFTRSVKNPYIELSSSAPLPLPSSIRYCIGDSSTPYISGRTLSLEVPNALERYVPLIIQDYSSMYRVMLKIEAEKSSAGIANDSQVSFPFTVTCSNWTDFTVEGASSILFSLDGGGWVYGEGSVKIDRTKEHEVMWKYDNESDDRKRSFILPAKPALTVMQTSGSSPVKVSLSNSAFSFKPADSKAFSSASSWYADSIYGEHYNKEQSFDVYYKGIRQGVISSFISIDKKPPAKPLFTSSSPSFYARDTVTVKIQSSEPVYYSVSDPVISNFGFSDLEIKTAQSNGNKKQLEYKPYKNASFILNENTGGAVFYSLSAYAMDASGNKSETEFFSAVVDGYNYYVNSSVTADYVCDGSPARPFTDLKDIVQILNTKNYTRLHITGTFNQVPSLTFTKDCDIIGIDTAHIIFAPESALIVDNADVAISGCIIEQDNTSSVQNTEEQVYQRKLFLVKNASLYLDNVDIIYTSFSNASLFQTDNSTLRIKESSVTVQTSSYASAVTAVGSIIGCLSSYISVIAPTASAFSSSKGSLIVDSSEIKVTSSLGRIAEISSSMYLLTNNTLAYIPLSKTEEALAKQKKSAEPVWADYSSVNKGYENNKVTGF